MTLVRISVAAFIALALPLAALAQEDALHSTIRAGIMSDPRSAQLSQAEINTMVNALADQAQTQGTAQDYLNGQNSFEPAQSPVYEPPSMTLTPLDIALLTLIIVLAGVAVFLVWHRKARRAMPPSAGMVA